jgi:hypothetical protein
MVAANGHSSGQKIFGITLGKGNCTLAHKIESAQSFIEGRGGDFCRACVGTDLFSGLNLGSLPIANELLPIEVREIDKFPLHLKICSDCGLGQVADVVTPERIFRDYRYLSSMSSTFLQHASDFVIEQFRSGVFESGDWVLEIASNDGYLLKNFIPLGIKVIGVEPAENVAEISRNLGIHTISEFFSSKLAIQLLESHGFPKMIIANNVMAHVPDLMDFVKGLRVLCGSQTQISVENPSLSNILIGMQFDTIYHEHYSYLSALAVQNICKLNGLELIKVEQLTIHGGSNRYWLKNSIEPNQIDESVGNLVKHEIDSGLFTEKNWKLYSSHVSEILNNFSFWLRTNKEIGKKIYGYGAAAKASTILNCIQINPEHISAIADLSLEKQGRFMPPHGIRIISPDELFFESPTDVVIFPWNIKFEIARQLRMRLGSEVRLWCAIPEMHEVYI